MPGGGRLVDLPANHHRVRMGTVLERLGGPPVAYKVGVLLAEPLVVCFALGQQRQVGGRDEGIHRTAHNGGRLVRAHLHHILGEGPVRTVVDVDAHARLPVRRLADVVQRQLLLHQHLRYGLHFSRLVDDRIHPVAKRDRSRGHERPPSKPAVRCVRAYAHEILREGVRVDGRANLTEHLVTVPWFARARHEMIAARAETELGGVQAALQYTVALVRFGTVGVFHPLQRGRYVAFRAVRIAIRAPVIVQVGRSDAER